MRVIVHGVGAVGSTLAGALALAGHEVVGIARGAQLDAIRSNGLLMRTPDGDKRAHFDCVGDPAEIDLRPDDAILLCVKTQHTQAALDQLEAAGMSDQPLFCFQNGVENERIALRRFPNVHGVTVMLPAEFLSPGIVAAFGTPCHGIFDIGRYPGGSDDADEALARLLATAGFHCEVQSDVMTSKYGKLLVNLGNMVGAAVGSGAETRDIVALLTAEAESAYRAAGIAWKDVGLNSPRRASHMRSGEIEGADRVGTSTAQSLVRGVGSIETEYLNGEIVLLGRMHGVPVPANTALCRLSDRIMRDGLGAGSVGLEDLRRLVGL